jgi:hypothetical protein
MFSASSFIFNGIPSEFYNLYIGYSGKDSKAGAGESEEPASNDISLLTQKIYRRPSPLLYGVEQIPVLSFYLSMYIPNGGLDEQAFSKVSGWLFGNMQYGTLRICQNDMTDIYFRCFFTKPQTNRYGNFIRALNSTVVCDAPWGWRSPKTYNYSWLNTYDISQVINFYNETDNNYYTYPTKLVITANSFGGNITITNATDNGRQFVLTAAPYEVITFNCFDQTVSSSINPLPLQNFNGNWLRLLKGVNLLNVTGNPLSVAMTVERAVKIGG